MFTYILPHRSKEKDRYGEGMNLSLTWFIRYTFLYWNLQFINHVIIILTNYVFLRQLWVTLTDHDDSVSVVVLWFSGKISLWHP